MTNIFDAQFASKQGEQQLESLIREEVNNASVSPVERFNILDTISTTPTKCLSVSTLRPPRAARSTCR